MMEEKKKRRHLGGTSDGREEEAGMPNPHTCFSSNRASIVLAAIEQARMVPVMGNPGPHVHDIRHRMEVPMLSHQKSDVTSTRFGFWLKEEEAPFLPC